jgi:predicted HicB family RNase H-like nuclease
MKKKFTTTIDDELIKQAKIKAIEEEISVAELIEKLLKQYLKQSDN